MICVATCHVDMLGVKNRSRSKPSRLNIRLSSDIKDKVMRAAAILGQDLTEFTVSTLGQRASEIIESHEQILLSEKEYEFFLNYMDKPARKPSRYSMKALVEYKRQIRNG